MRSRLGKVPRLPARALCSWKRGAPSAPHRRACTSTGTGCQEWARAGTGVEWSPVTHSTSSPASSSAGSARSTLSIASTLAAKFPSSPAMSVPFTCTKKKSKSARCARSAANASPGVSPAGSTVMPASSATPRYIG